MEIDLRKRTGGKGVGKRGREGNEVEEEETGGKESEDERKRRKG